MPSPDRGGLARARLPGERWFLDAAAAERARAVASGRLAAVPVRQAATVLVLRDDPGGLQAFVLRRHSRMAFAAGVLAFPGGAVEPGEGDGMAAARMAAVREVFEEIGVLLAAPADGSAPGRLPAAAAGTWQAHRSAVAAGQERMASILDRYGWTPRDDLLVPFARWVTPRFEARRFDTWFFLAALPPGQQPADVSGEASEAFWARPGDLLADLATGRERALPPTVAALRAVAGQPEVSAALAAAAGSDLTPVRPGWIDDGTAVRLVLPGEPGWPGQGGDE